MKKFINTALSTLLVAALLVGCGTSTPADDDASSTSDAVVETTSSVDETTEATTQDDNAEATTQDDSVGGDDDVATETTPTPTDSGRNRANYERRTDRDEDIVDDIFENVNDDRIDDFDEVEELAVLLYLNGNVYGEENGEALGLDEALNYLRDNARDFTIDLALTQEEWYVVELNEDWQRMRFRVNSDRTVEVSRADDLSDAEVVDPVVIATDLFDAGLREDHVEDLADVLENNYEINYGDDDDNDWDDDWDDGWDD